MTVRYYVADLPPAGGDVQLPEAEAHHARTVMRVRPGAAVVLFDGQGHEAEARVESVSRRGVSCRAQRAVSLPRDNTHEVTLAIAMPKGDRARDLIERLTELGVDRVIPIHCQRSPWEVSPGAIEKWQRVVIEACKQCRRNRLLQIESPCRWDDYLAEPLGPQETAWLAHPGGGPAEMTDCSVGATAAAGNVRPRVRAAIGPEGGFTQQEVESARRCGWTTVDLGARIYRIETAAILLAVKVACL